MANVLGTNRQIGPVTTPNGPPVTTAPVAAPKPAVLPTPSPVAAPAAAPATPSDSLPAPNYGAMADALGSTKPANYNPIADGFGSENLTPTTATPAPGSPVPDGAQSMIGTAAPAPPVTSTPGTQDQATAGSIQGYTPTNPNDAAPIGAVNGIDPVKITPTSMEGYQPFVDSAFNQAKSRLDPMFQQGEDKFRQDMVNRGIAQGSDAYGKAWDDFSRSKNDAYASAQNNAMQQGLAAQGQAYGQGATQAQLAQAMRQFSDQYGLNRDQLDLNAQGQFTQQDMDAYRLNQASTLQDFQLAQALMGMVPAAGATQIDTYSPYGAASNAANAQQANANNQSNGMWGAIGQLGAAWLGSGG